MQTRNSITKYYFLTSSNCSPPIQASSLLRTAYHLRRCPRQRTQEYPFKAPAAIPQRPKNMPETQKRVQNCLKLKSTRRLFAYPNYLIIFERLRPATYAKINACASPPSDASNLTPNLFRTTRD